MDAVDNGVLLAMDVLHGNSVIKLALFLIGEMAKTIPWYNDVSVSWILYAEKAHTGCYFEY